MSKISTDQKPKNIIEEFEEYFNKYPNEKNSFFYYKFPNINQVKIRLYLSSLRKAKLREESNIYSKNYWFLGARGTRQISKKDYDIIKKI